MTICCEINMNGCINEESPVDAGLLRTLPRYQLDRSLYEYLHNITGSNRNQAFISENLTFFGVNDV